MNANYIHIYVLNEFCLDDNKIYEYSCPHDPDLDIQLGVLQFLIVYILFYVIFVGQVCL